MILSKPISEKANIIIIVKKIVCTKRELPEPIHFTTLSEKLSILGFFSLKVIDLK